ncbi:hypothetical protein C8J57DRAFT_1454686 [Mycena rebaudengoi]|nr:hypothetical protein C8J57DRAFT_1454686 [Mycena rebaudengoi]
MSLEIPCIPADPDISGIGVRIAIYVQTLLSFLPAISALWDGNVAPYELEAVNDQAVTILITAFGVLISAMVQAQTLGLSNFHANIILGLSWMNNTNTFIYFLLYVHHTNQPGPDHIPLHFRSWLCHLTSRRKVRRTFNPCLDKPPPTLSISRWQVWHSTPGSCL